MKYIFLAKTMPVDESKPVFCSRVGETKSAAKEAVLERLKDHRPSIANRVNWDGYVKEKDGWRFVLKKKTLHE